MLKFKKITSLVLSLMLVISFSQVAVFANELDETNNDVVSQEEITDSDVAEDNNDADTADDELIEDDIDPEDQDVEETEAPEPAKKSVKSAPPLRAGSSNLFAGGSGTIDDPYLISDDEQLQNINEDLTAYYELTNDIECMSSSFESIGSENTPFIGVLNGHGYTVSDLVVSTNDNVKFDAFIRVNSGTSW